MVSTRFPDNVNYMAIAMVEKARIRDKMPSAILNVALGSGPNGNGAQEVPNNAKVGFFVSPSCNEKDSFSRLYYGIEPTNAARYLHLRKTGKY